MASVHLPSRALAPARAVGRRIFLALALIALTATLVYLDRDGYEDAAGDGVGLADAFYYATVSVTTTGYGDITPVTPVARAITTVVVTPTRVLFLILVVGTTVEVLTEQSRAAVRVNRWRRRVRNHVIVCGYGSKGRSAVEAVLGQGVDKRDVVVVDVDDERLREANRAGIVGVLGSATRTAVLQEAGIAGAHSVVVAPHEDDTAVLITLTARELNPGAIIVAAVREEENVHLLRQSGANSVIRSAHSPGRLLGLATRNPRVVGVLEDLLDVGAGLDIIERPISAKERGGPPQPGQGELVVAVVRGDELLRFDDPRLSRLDPGDQIVALCARAR
ncbi:MAG: NAD-binding protein [Actinomycetota bacterium]|nr:NAD-binding protein [Actinomycetota bacterium]